MTTGRLPSNTILGSLGFLERYKIHHVLFWAMYHFTWWTIFSGSVTEVFQSVTEPHGIVKYLGYVLYQAAGVYFCLYVLIPKLLQKGKYIAFFVATTGVVLLMTTLITSNYFIAAMVADASVYELFKISPESPLSIFKYNALPSCVAATTLGMSIKLTKIWVDSQKRQQVLEKEKLETELKFLKSQFNPHFLFNTINSIFVLINKNPEMASESLVKFSSLLRYQLYECNSNQIPLENELDYIESFIELESLRQNQNFELTISMPKLGREGFTIAPFILIPFIENAFKHLSEDKKLKKWVNLDILLEDGSLQFNLINSANFELQHSSADVIGYGGLGLKNVQRRLDIIYPDSYSLVVTKGNDSYAVKMVLKLMKDRKVVLKKTVG